MVIGANNNKVVGSDSSLEPNLFKSIKHQKKIFKDQRFEAI